jgi:hypothetical protein
MGRALAMAWFSLITSLMQTAVGIFDRIEDARRAGREIVTVAPAARVRLVSPAASGAEIDSLPTEEGEQPGMGAAVGGVVGGATGAAIASLVVPPVGVAALAAIAGGALLGAGGGALAGDAVEDTLSQGIPRDELVLYQEALRRGRSLVVVVAETTEEADRVRDRLAASGALSVDAAREEWRVGLVETDVE